MDNESGESKEPMEEVPLEELVSKAATIDYFSSRLVVDYFVD